MEVQQGSGYGSTNICQTNQTPEDLTGVSGVVSKRDIETQERLDATS